MIWKKAKGPVVWNPVLLNLERAYNSHHSFLDLLILDALKEHLLKMLLQWNSMSANKPSMSKGKIEKDWESQTSFYLWRSGKGKTWSQRHLWLIPPFAFPESYFSTCSALSTYPVLICCEFGIEETNSFGYLVPEKSWKKSECRTFGTVKWSW